MSDWLERELARDLAPVAAPPMLAIRLGLARAKRWEFPHMAFAVAAAVVLVIGAGYAASRTEALDLRLEAGVDVAEDSSLSAARPPRCDGGAARPLRVRPPFCSPTPPRQARRPAAPPAPVPKPVATSATTCSGVSRETKIAGINQGSPASKRVGNR